MILDFQRQNDRKLRHRQGSQISTFLPTLLSSVLYGCEAALHDKNVLKLAAGTKSIQSKIFPSM